MNIIKKIGIGLVTSIVTLILAIVAISMFNANVSGEGYFHNRGNGLVVAMMVLAIIMLIITMVVPFFEIKNKLIKTIVDVVIDVLRVLIPIFIIIGLIAFAGDRVEGLAYIYGSNEDAQQEVQTAANLASGSLAINGLIMFGVTAVVAIISSFFGISREAKVENIKVTTNA